MQERVRFYSKIFMFEKNNRSIISIQAQCSGSVFSGILGPVNIESYPQVGQPSKMFCNWVSSSSPLFSNDKEDRPEKTLFCENDHRKDSGCWFAVKSNLIQEG